MFLGVRWQSHPPSTVTVELWDAPPPPPAARGRGAQAAAAAEGRAAQAGARARGEEARDRRAEGAAAQAEAEAQARGEGRRRRTIRVREAHARAGGDGAEEARRGAPPRRRGCGARPKPSRPRASAPPRRAPGARRIRQPIRAKVRGNMDPAAGHRRAIRRRSSTWCSCPPARCCRVQLAQVERQPGATTTAVERAILKSSPLPLARPTRRCSSGELELTFRPLGLSA